MILTDTFIVENAQLITEDRNGKTVRKLRGVFGRCDEKNNNGRIYSKKILEREVIKIQEAMEERRLLGELDHPTNNAVRLSNVSHLITGLSFKGNDLLGECELLDTPSGKVAQALVEGGVKIGISSRGMGTLSEQGDGTKQVNEDYKLVTFDLVADPSTRGAFPSIAESTQSKLVEEIVHDTLDKAAKEKVFTTMLKNKLREKLDINQAPAPYKTVRQLQKEANKKKKKPTAEDPFRNWEDFYGPYTGPPRKARKTRGYDDAETVTAPQEVIENKFGALKYILTEVPEQPVNEFHLLYESVAATQRKAVAKGEFNPISGATGPAGKRYEAALKMKADLQKRRGTRRGAVLGKKPTQRSRHTGMNPDDPLTSFSKKYDDSRAPVADRRAARRATARAGGETHQVRREVGHAELDAAKKRRTEQGTPKGQQIKAKNKAERAQKPIQDDVNLFFPEEQGFYLNRTSYI